MTLTKAIEVAREGFYITELEWKTLQEIKCKVSALAASPACNILASDLEMWIYNIKDSPYRSRATIPDKPMTEQEITKIILTCIREGKYNDVGMSINIFQKLKAANILYVEEK